ncbi:hypothetical protein SBA7_290017 [Candidatus Sulfotelmatobacter sp. SbA7]|jgi:hypothetical protein|nr:hypothetical protein SBA7_290017 [Candidatus Sulfotelmatobacter sp. SbA7]
MSPTVPETTVGAENSIPARSPSEKCARIKNLGFAASKHINMYGERFEIVSDPFPEGDCIAVHAISENDSEHHPEHHPKIRTLRLPAAILVGKTVHN